MASEVSQHPSLVSQVKYSPRVFSSSAKQLNGVEKSPKKRNHAGTLASRCDRENVIWILGLVVIVTGCIINLCWNDVLQTAVNKEFTLSESSRAYKLWVKNPIPLYIHFYFFNWTNSEGVDLLRKGYKPEFTEVGPYVFREDSEKVDLVWNGNGTVTYKKRRKWYFDAEKSAGSLDDNVTSLNVIVLTAVHFTRNWSSFLRRPAFATLSMSNQKMSVTKKVREFLFEGYSDPLIDLAKMVPGLSALVPFDRFGWFYTRNGSTDFDGVFNVETGTNGMSNLGVLKTWNYDSSTPFYDQPCGSVRGSAGEFWPPERKKTEDVVLFAPDLCRYIDFKFSEEVVLQGVQGYKYDVGSELFDNGTSDSRNKCFCNGECLPSGVLNVSACRLGAPGFVSFPHFNGADSSYRDAVVGMKPDSKKHSMYMILEPSLGIPLEVAARLQINLMVTPDPDVRMYRDIKRTLFPVVWFEQHVITPPEMTSAIRILLALPIIGFVLSIVMMVSGFALVLAYFYRTRRRSGFRQLFVKRLT